MSKYILSIKRGKDFYEIPWGKKYNYNNPYSLESIDSFTSYYNNEDELRNDLISKGLISPNDIGKELRITYRYGGITKLIKRDFIFANTKDYLEFDILLAYIIESIRNYESNPNGISYIKKLINHYQGTYNKVDLNYLLQVATNIDEDNPLKTEQMETFISRLSKFLYSETHSKDKISYKPLHDLATFVISQDDQLKQKDKKSKAKTLVQKKELEGQLSFY